MADTNVTEKKKLTSNVTRTAGKAISVYAKQAYRKDEVRLHLFLTQALDWEG